MFYLLLFFLHFFLPGLLILYLFGARRLVFLLSLPLSYTLLILNLFCLRWINAPVDFLFRLMVLELFALLILAAAKSLLRPSRLPHGLKAVFRKRRADAVAMAVLFALLASYLVCAGPYTEVPSDALSHLERFQEQIKLLGSGKLTGVPAAVQLLACQGEHWYFFHAYLCRLAGLSIVDSIGPLTAANTVAFTFAVFFLGLMVFAKEREPRRRKVFAASLSAAFAFLHTGVSVFAYARYYAFAPSILNLVIAFAVVAVYLLWVDGRWPGLRAFALIIPLCWTMLVIHSQELAFTVLAVGAISLTASVRRLSSAMRRRAEEMGRARYGARPVFGMIGLAVCFFAAFWLIRSARQPRLDYAWYLIKIPQWIPLFSRGFIVNPSTLFLSVIALWGGAVYLLFLFNLKEFKQNDYIIGLMILPALSLFNPFLVDMALRYQGSVVTIMYRIGYILPLPFVAGWLGAAALRSIVCLESKITRRFRAGLMLVILIVPLLPSELLGNSFWISRFPTLKRVAPENDARHWRGLIDFLNRERAGCKVLTDPVTGYLINALTSCSAASVKFSYSKVELRVSEDGENLLYVTGGIDEESNWLLVINERDGALSETGKLSGHWPEDILLVSKYWKPNLKKFVSRHPECFRRIWACDGVEVFDVKAEALNELVSDTPRLFSAAPVLLEGPGIFLSWSAVKPRRFVSYQVQYSEDYEDWHELSSNRDYRYPWFYHQGKVEDVYGSWSWCLPAGSTYYYRVRALYDSGPADWSNIVTGRVANYKEESG